MNPKDVNKLKSEIHYNTSPNHDQYIHYTLGNELGAKLAVSTSENKVYISLLSKTDDVLSTINFDCSGSGSGGLSSVALDHENKRLVFIETGGQVLQCDLSSLYESKQDVITDLSNIRINALSGKEAKEWLERKEAVWDAKSTVTVADSGRSTNYVNYITVDGVEWKITVDPDEFQEKLTAGANITIDENNVISAVDTKNIYTGGDGIIVDNNNNIISVTEEIKTKDYNPLINKPSINGIELVGALLGKDLNLDIVEYISYKEYTKIEDKEKKLYFVCRNPKDVEAEDCWRIYLQDKLIGEWDVEGGMVTLPKFPFRFPVRFAGKWQK